MAQPVTVLVSKSDGLSFIHRIYMIKGKNRFLLTSFSIPCHGHMCTQTRIIRRNNKCKHQNTCLNHKEKMFVTAIELEGYDQT